MASAAAAYPSTTHSSAISWLDLVLDFFGFGLGL